MPPMNATNNSTMPAPMTKTTDEWEIPADVTPDYSVVVPFFNESNAAVLLLEEILRVMRKLPGIPECVCVGTGIKFCETAQ